jgi:hypothetical protein
MQQAKNLNCLRVDTVYDYIRGPSDDEFSGVRNSAGPANVGELQQQVRLPFDLKVEPDRRHRIVEFNVL